MAELCHLVEVNQAILFGQYVIEVNQAIWPGPYVILLTIILLLTELLKRSK